MRVLMGVPAPGATAGGPALHLPMLVEDLQRRTDIELRTMPYGRWQEGEPLPLKIWHQCVDVARYPGRVRAAQPDLVHLNSSLDRRTLVRDNVFVWLTHRLGRPVFLKWHGSETHLLQTGSPAWRLLGRLLLQSADAIGALSEPEAEEIRALPHAPPCFVVQNAIDVARYATRYDLHARLGIPTGTPLLLFISRLIPGKGLEDVLAALPEVRARHAAHLVVVGDGPERAAAEASAGSLGVADAVHFVGRVAEDDARNFYNGADVLVFPSRLTEGFPMVLFQGVAAGLGIVTTRLRAAVQYLREPDHGLFVEPGSPASVAAALGRLLGDPSLLEAMHTNNRILARRFDRENVAADFARIYRRITASREAAHRDGCLDDQKGPDA